MSDRVRNHFSRVIKGAVLLVMLILCGTLLPTAAQAPQPCPGSLPSRLTLGSRGQLSTTTANAPTLNVRVRDAAGQGARVIGQLRPRITFVVMSGPVCKDGMTWWQVVAGAVIGWIAEGDNDNYFVEPLSTPIPNVLPITATPIVLSTPTPAAAVAAGTSVPNQPAGAVPAPSVGSGFALYLPGKIDIAPTLSPYRLAPDFGNIAITEPLTRSQLDYLQRNGFIVSPGSANEFYQVYQQAADARQSLFITSDSLLHAYQLAFGKVTRNAESRFFLPLLQNLVKSGVVEAGKIYQAAKGGDWENASRRVVAYWSVGAKLLDPNFGVPEYVGDLVTSEIANITNAAGGGQSAVFNELESGENWAFYAPRGHYTRSEALAAYYRAMTYYGRMVFRLSKAEETRSALMLLYSLRNGTVGGRPALVAWSDLYEATAFLTGKSDDLTPPQYLIILDQVYGANANIKLIQGRGVDTFSAAAQALPTAKVLTAPIPDAENLLSETKGLSLMGQQFGWDNYVLSQLVYDKVGNKNRPRRLPSPFDVFYALGVERAQQLAEKEGSAAFENYTKQAVRLRNAAEGLTEAEWGSTLTSGWFYALRGLNQDIPGGYPSFMINQPYADRNLYSALGAWMALKQDIILLAEAGAASPAATPSTNRGKSVPPVPVRPPSYVEPVPLFWARLAALAEITESGLSRRQMIDAADSELLKKLADLARKLQAYSIKELKGESLTDAEQAVLINYGTTLESILLTSAEKPQSGEGRLNADAPSSITQINDLGSDFDRGRVLQAGSGRAFNLYVAVPIGGKLVLAHGAIFSFYTIEQPAKNRLSDDAWEQLVRDGKTPPLPNWTFSFLAQDAPDPDYGAAIRAFHATLTNMLWYNPTNKYTELRESSGKVERFLAGQLEPLARARQYEGRQLIEISFRSVTVSGDKKTVTIASREMWKGELHNSTPDDLTDGPKIGERGPYAVGVSYTLVRDSNGNWVVSDVVLTGSTPAWTNKTP